MIAAQRPQGEANVAAQFLDNRQSSTVSMVLPEVVDVSEPEACFSSRFLGRESPPQSFALGQFEVSLDLVVQLPFVLTSLYQCHEPPHEQPRAHGLASRNRVTRALARSHPATSIWSCFRPARVSE